ncbi:hypothetical protein PYCCODRAFT_1472536 [Trametes coccinea BRFM310]|uniref:EF-hand domain-containing protein n=1 Tax=Trametes coccinea (strain BRFM310) TaxID=1353009 RepID=A0A1Y2I5X1_TRAC3|nr:hypothetical protein PYCCODRAFT_1472536 [Trametes coccinea BRFM310]
MWKQAPVPSSNRFYTSSSTTIYSTTSEISQHPTMQLKYGLQARMYKAIVGVLRGGDADSDGRVDFEDFVDALLRIGFRADPLSSAAILVLWAPPELAHNNNGRLDIIRPQTENEWSTTQYIDVAHALKDKFGLSVGNFNEFESKQADGSAVVVPPYA